jgi:hypothetical protein
VVVGEEASGDVPVFFHGEAGAFSDRGFVGAKTAETFY